jgi:hypothetical protein
MQRDASGRNGVAAKKDQKHSRAHKGTAGEVLGREEMGKSVN